MLEAGVNHNGDIGLAKELVAAAAESGADLIKFQSFRAQNIASGQAKKADYQYRNTESSDDQLTMLKNLEPSLEDHEIILEECVEKKEIRFSRLHLMKTVSICL